MQQDTRLFSLKDVQRMLKMPRWKIIYFYETEQIPEPLRVGGHRIFTEDDVRGIALKLGVNLNKDMQFL